MSVKIVQGYQKASGDSEGLPWIQKDPSAKKDYQRDFADEDDPLLDADADEVLTAATWTVYRSANEGEYLKLW